MFEGFTHTNLTANGVGINLRYAGSGPPLLLLHGYPQTHVMWHKVAPALAERYTVVVPDMRGYGDSDKPPAPDGDLSVYCKRTTANDQVEVMSKLGFESFHVVGHDRGARVGHRMALDHPARVKSFTCLDVVPSQAAFENMDADLAFAWFHWHLMRQPSPLPETLIGSNAEGIPRLSPGALDGSGRLDHRGGVRRVPSLLRQPRHRARDLPGLPGRRSRPPARRG